MTVFILVKAVAVVIFGLMGIYFVCKWFSFLMTCVHDIRQMIEELKNENKQ